MNFTSKKLTFHEATRKVKTAFVVHHLFLLDGELVWTVHPVPRPQIRCPRGGGRGDLPGSSRRITENALLRSECPTAYNKFLETRTHLFANWGFPAQWAHPKAEPS